MSRSVRSGFLLLYWKNLSLLGGRNQENMDLLTDAKYNTFNGVHKIIWRFKQNLKVALFSPYIIFIVVIVDTFPYCFFFNHIVFLCILSDTFLSIFCIYIMILSFFTVLKMTKKNYECV